MKEIFIIEDSLINKISYYHVLVFLVMLPFERAYSEIILISLVAHTVIHLTKEKSLSLKAPFLLLISVYALTIICALYSSDKQQALTDCEKQLALFLFPFIFSVTGLNIGKYKHRLLKAFAVVCTLTTLYLYADALKVISYNKLPPASLFSSSFMNHNFSAPIALHATYFSMYAGISIAVFFYFFIVSAKIYQRIFYALGLIILSAGILQLSSRSVLIAVFIMINFIIPFFLLKKSARKKFIFISLLFSVVLIFSVTKTESFKKRFVTDLKSDLLSSKTEADLQESRMQRWASAWQLIEQSPVIGYGTGSETSLLKEKYFENRLYISYLNGLNVHNEYLSFMLKAGVAGLILYLYVLATAVSNAFQRKDVLFLSFLIIVMVVSFSENLLDSNKGIFFFSFFLSFFCSPLEKIKLPFISQNKIKHNGVITAESGLNIQTTVAIPETNKKQ